MKRRQTRFDCKKRHILAKDTRKNSAAASTVNKTATAVPKPKPTAKHNIKVEKVPASVSVTPSSSKSTNEFYEFKVLEFSADRKILRTPSFSCKRTGKFVNSGKEVRFTESKAVYYIHPDGTPAFIIFFRLDDGSVWVTDMKESFFSTATAVEPSKIPSAAASPSQNLYSGFLYDWSYLFYH